MAAVLQRALQDGGPRPVADGRLPRLPARRPSRRCPRPTTPRTSRTVRTDDARGRGRVTRYGRHAHHHRQPHRQAVRGARSRTARFAPMDLRQIKTARRRLRADDLRPGVPEHRRVPEPHHLHRRRQGHPALPRLPDRAAGRAEHLSRDGVPDPLRRAADDAPSSTAWTQRDHAAHDAAREHQEAHGGLPVRRPPDGRRSSRTVGALSTFYPDAKQIFDEDVAPAADAPADREGADASPPTPIATASAGRTSTRTTT